MEGIGCYGRFEWEKRVFVGDLGELMAGWDALYRLCLGRDGRLDPRGCFRVRFGRGLRVGRWRTFQVRNDHESCTVSSISKQHHIHRLLIGRGLVMGKEEAIPLDLSRSPRSSHPPCPVGRCSSSPLSSFRRVW
jgi:hypothetical protein